MSDPPEMDFCILASGSRGNAIYIRAGETAILVDAGLSGKDIQRRMADRGLDPKSVTALVVSHEHRDHIHGVGVLSRRFHLPVYITPNTLRSAKSAMGPITEIRRFDSDRTFTIGDLSIQPFSISHDASEPSGFVFSANGWRLGLATDLGAATGLVQTRLADCQALILEANHDPQLLMDGPYPWPLKQRIRSRVGHLSNMDAARLLAEIVHPGLHHVALAHLSETNNRPEIALDTVSTSVEHAVFSLTVAQQHRPGPIIHLGPSDQTDH